MALGLDQATARVHHVGQSTGLGDVEFRGELLNPQSGKCLDDPASNTTPGTQLEIWDCNNGANQHWTLPSA